jgi:GGDEF domain-containing protein
LTTQIDQLAGLPARQPFLTAFERLAAETRSDHLVLVAVDVDRFLAFMNSEAWFTGDKLLLKLAKVIEAHAPLPDCVMRQGTRSCSQ